MLGIMGSIRKRKQVIKRRRNILKVKNKNHGFILFRMPIILLVFLLAVIPFTLINLSIYISDWHPVSTKKLKKIDWKTTRFSEVASVYNPPLKKWSVSFVKVYGKIYTFLFSLVP